MKQLKLRSALLTVVLVGLIIGQTLSVLSIFGSAVVTSGNSDSTTIISNDSEVEIVINWNEIDATHYSATLTVNRKTSLYYVTRLEYWAYDSNGLEIFHEDNTYSRLSGYTSRTKTIVMTGSFEESQSVSIKLKGQVARTSTKTSEAIFYKTVPITPDTNPPVITNFAVNDGIETLSANMHFKVTDQTNVDSYEYQILNSESLIVKSGNIDIDPDTKSYTGMVEFTRSDLQIASDNWEDVPFTAYVRATDTLDFTSEWSIDEFIMLGDNDVDGPSITFGTESPSMAFGYDAWQDCVPELYLTWSVSDPSGLSEVHVHLNDADGLGIAALTSPTTSAYTGSYPISGTVGTTTLFIEATDNDLNRGAIDQSRSTASGSQNVADDDADGPSILVTNVGISTEGDGATVLFEMHDLDGGASWWDEVWVDLGMLGGYWQPYTTLPEVSGVDAYTITIEKYNYDTAAWEFFDEEVHINDDTEYVLETGSMTVVGEGYYHIVIEATNGDDDRVGDADISVDDGTYFTIIDDDESAPSITLVIAEIPFVGAQISYGITDLQSGVDSWSMEITRNGEFYLSDGEIFSSTNYLPIVGSLTISERGNYHITMIATNGDTDSDGDQETAVEEQDFRVHDWTAPEIAFEGDFDQTDANPQIVNITVSDMESGLKQVIILFGLDLEVLEDLDIDLSGLIEALIGISGLDLNDLLGDDMIWIPITITNLDVINDLFDAMLDSLFGDIIGTQIGELLGDFIDQLMIENLEEEVIDFIAENLGDAIGSILESVGIFADEVITMIIDTVRNIVIELLVDESFVEGQLTYTKSIDMRYFAWLRLFGNFQIAVYAQNTEDFSDYDISSNWITDLIEEYLRIDLSGILDPTFILTSSFEASNVYNLCDDDTELSVENFQIFGDADNLYVTFEEDDYSGIAYLITIDDIPVLPCLNLYTAEKVGNLWIITFSRLPVNILQALGISDLGSHTMTLYIMDLDSDWLIPYVFDAEFGMFELDFELVAPEITYEYTGDGTDGNAGQVIFSIVDDSAYTITSGQLVNDLAVQIDDAQTFSISVMDVFGNQACESIAIQLEDDDINAPEISIVYNGDGTDGNAGQVIMTATDASGIYGSDIAIFDLAVIIDVPQTFEAVFFDADMDRANDQLYSIGSITITLSDDDTQAPIIAWVYHGDYNDANSGYIEVSASDASGLSVDPSGIYLVSNELGVHSFEFTAVDNDNDRLGDSISTSVSVDIDISDDDITVDIVNLAAIASLYDIIIAFEDIDASGIASCDWVSVDGELVAFDYIAEQISITNDWILELGMHTVEFQLTDADNDRVGDEASAIFSVQFEITEDLIAEWIAVELEELLQMVMDCDCWKANQGNGKGSNYVHYQNSMINKINALMNKMDCENYAEVYCQLINDVYKHLGGRFYESGEVFKNAWIFEGECMENFRVQLDGIIFATSLLL